MPPSTRRLRNGRPHVLGRRRDQVRDLIRHALQHRPAQVRRRRAARQAEQHAARLGHPVRRPQPHEARHEHHRLLRVGAPRQLLHRRRGVEQLQPVAQPLHRRPGDENAAFQGVLPRPVAGRRQRRQQPMPRRLADRARCAAGRTPRCRRCISPRPPRSSTGRTAPPAGRPPPPGSAGRPAGSRGRAWRRSRPRWDAPPAAARPARRNSGTAPRPRRRCGGSTAASARRWSRRWRGRGRRSAARSGSCRWCRRPARPAAARRAAARPDPAASGSWSPRSTGRAPGRCARRSTARRPGARGRSRRCGGPARRWPARPAGRRPAPTAPPSRAGWSGRWRSAAAPRCPRWASACGTTSRTDAQISSGSCSTQPGRG